ncbi:MAG: S9 family peptidase [Burkholderiaceae bacterium]|nr:MAG: S9 family peptidase [Burkholderiaceae bacterium]
MPLFTLASGRQRPQRPASPLRHLGAGLVLACLSAWMPMAQADTLLPSDPALRQQILKYTTPARYAMPTLSPDGRHLAVLSPVGGRQNLVVIDLAQRKAAAVTRMGDFDVVSVRWVGSNHLAFTLGDLEAPGGSDYQDGGGLFLVDRQGERFRELAPTQRAARARSLGRVPDLQITAMMGADSDEFLMSSNERSVSSRDLYRVSASTGRKTLLTFDRPGDVASWMLDESLQIRGAVVSRATEGDKPQRRRVLMWREVAGGAWREAADLGVGPAAVYPVAMKDDQTLYVSTARGRDTSALYTMSLRTGELSAQPVAADPRFDIQRDASGEAVPGIMFHPVRHRPFAIAIQGDVTTRQYLDEEMAALHEGLKKTFPGALVALQPSDGDRVLVTVSSDVQAAKVYLWDKSKRQLTEELVTRPELKDGDLQPLHPFLLKTRDGLEIPGYYVLPKGYKEGQRLPTLVHIHGGPHVRADSWGPMSTTGVREAQVLASQGFAVVIPNFRITPGLGRKIYDQGFGTVGTKMSDDHEDAAKWAVEAGFADPKRICIGGSSSGGYATVQAMVKAPDLWACGVSGLLVVDRELQLKSSVTDYAGNPASVKQWRRMMGQDGDGWDKVRAISPVYKLDQLKAPLMMWAGRDDTRTPLEQFKLLEEKMGELGKRPVVSMIKDGEGHGYRKPENRLDLYEQMVLFLRQTLQGPAGPGGSGQP